MKTVDLIIQFLRNASADSKTQMVIDYLYSLKLTDEREEVIYLFID